MFVTFKMVFVYVTLGTLAGIIGIPYSLVVGNIRLLYRVVVRGIVPLGKAAELAEVDVIRFKEALRERNITRIAPETLAETEAMAQAAVHAAGRSA